MLSDAIPSSRARLPAARAAAISISGIMGSVSSICRSAVAVMTGTSSTMLRRLEREEKRGRGLHPLRNATDLIERQQRDGVDRQHRGQNVGGRKSGFDPGGAGLRNVVHGVPPQLSGPRLSNATATRYRSVESLLSF